MIRSKVGRCTLQTTEEVLADIKNDLLSLLDEIPPTLNNEIKIKLAYIWQSVKSLLICRRDEMQTIRDLCQDIINLTTKGGNQNREIATYAETISHLTSKLSEIEPHKPNLVNQIIKSSKKTEILHNIRDTSPPPPPESTSLPPSQPRKSGSLKETRVMNYLEPDSSED